MHMDKQITQSILVMLYLMRGTEIAEVEGLWLVNRPKCFVSEDPDDSPKVWFGSPFIVTSLNSMRDPCNIIFMMSQLSALIFQWENHCTCTSEMSLFICTSAGIHARTLNTINAFKPLCLFLNPISMPVTLSPRYFSAPLYQSLNLFTHS